MYIDSTQVRCFYNDCFRRKKIFLYNYKQIICFLAIVSLVLFVTDFMHDYEGSFQTGLTDIEDPDPSSFTPQVSPVIIRMPFFKLSAIQPNVWFSEPFLLLKKVIKCA